MITFSDCSAVTWHLNQRMQKFFSRGSIKDQFRFLFYETIVECNLSRYVAIEGYGTKYCYKLIVKTSNESEKIRSMINASFRQVENGVGEFKFVTVRRRRKRYLGQAELKRIKISYQDNH